MKNSSNNTPNTRIGPWRHFAPTPAQRLAPSLAAALFAVSQGARAVRAHDVAETVQAIKIFHTLLT